MLSPLNMLCWNIQGASRTDSIRYVGKLCRDNSVRLLVLLEPMSEVGQMEVVRRRLNFDNAASLIDRKIWLFWDSRFSLTYIEHAEQLVHVTASFGSGVSIGISVVYANAPRWPDGHSGRR